jgi:hypothetical protein
MIAAIVVPAGVRSIAMIRACLVSGRIAVFEDEGANRTRVLDLLVDREVERTAAFGLDLGLVMGSSEVRATPSAAPPQPRRANHPAGRDPMGRLTRTPAGTATLLSRTKASHFCANSRWTGQNPAFRIVGSNPTLSATLQLSTLSNCSNLPQSHRRIPRSRANLRASGSFRREFGGRCFLAYLEPDFALET